MMAMIIILECLIRLTINGCMAANTYCTTVTSKIGKITKKQTTDLGVTLWCFIGVANFLFAMKLFLIL